MKTITRYLTIYTVLVIAGLIAVATVNYKVDPAHIYGTGEYEKGIAQGLLSGYNVANVSNYDEPLMEKYYISGLERPKDVIVLGSSRSMLIGRALFPDKSFFNNWVPGACIGDYLSIYQLYQQRGFTPVIVVLGLDPWILNKNRAQVINMSLKNEFLAMVKTLSLSVNLDDYQKSVGNSKLTELFSMLYLKQSISALVSHQGEYYTTTSDFTSNGYLSDGTYIFNERARNNTIEQVDADATNYASVPNSSLEDYTELNQGFLKTLEAFVTYLQSTGVQVIFFLPPFHPIVYNAYITSPKYRIIQDAEICFRDMAAKHSIQVAGGYNPEDSGGIPGEFYDGMHPKESIVVKAFRGIQEK